MGEGIREATGSLLPDLSSAANMIQDLIPNSSSQPVISARNSLPPIGGGPDTRSPFLGVWMPPFSSTKN